MCEGYPISICRWVGVLRSRQPGKPSQTGKTSGDVPSSPFPPTRSRSGSASPRSGRLSRARRAPRERLRVALAVKESRSVEVKKNRTKVEVKGVVEGIKRTIFVWISVSVRRSDIRTSIQRSSPVAGQVGCSVPSLFACAPSVFTNHTTTSAHNTGVESSPSTVSLSAPSSQEEQRF